MPARFAKVHLGESRRQQKKEEKQMRKSKRILSLFLSFILISGLLPVSAMAKEVNTLVTNAVCLFSGTDGETTEFTFTTGAAGVYRFDLEDTNPRDHGGYLTLYSGTGELDPYHADYIMYGDMQPKISQSWNLNANTTYRLVHEAHDETAAGTHHYSLKPSYAGAQTVPTLSAGQSAQIKFLNVGYACEDYYVSKFNVRVAASGFYRIDSASGSYASALGLLPQTVYFKSGKDYSFSVSPASQSSAPANDEISLTEVQPELKILTEASPLAYTGGCWIAFTARSAGSYRFETDTYYAGIDAFNDEIIRSVYDEEHLAGELSSYSMQAGETVYFHVAAGNFNGQMTVTKLGGPSEPDPEPPAETLTLVSSSPANGAGNVRTGDNLVLTFSQKLSPTPNWESGSIYIKSYYTDTTITTIDRANFNKLGGSISGSQMIIPGALNFSVEKYYVTIDGGVIAAEDPKIEAFAGISSKDTLSFAPSLYGSDFKMGRDSLRFDNYAVKYSDEITEWLWVELLSKAGSDVVSVWRLLIAKQREDGVCFGMAAFMQQLYKGTLSAPQFGAYTSSEIKKTPQVNSIIVYYHLAQLLPQFRKADYSDIAKSQADLAKEIIDSLITDSNPIIVNLKESDSAYTPARYGKGHAVLAYAVDAHSDESNYIVYIADSNSMFRTEVVDNDISNIKLYFDYPSIMLIDKKTYSVAGYTNYPAGKASASRPYPLDIWLTSVYSGDDLSLLDSLNPYASTQYSVQSLPFGVIETSSSSFSIAANGRSAAVSNGKITGNLKLYSGSSTVGANTYYVEKADSYTITYPNTEEERTTTLYCSDSDISFLGEVTSNAASLQFLSNGEVSITGAKEPSTVGILLSMDTKDLFAVRVTAGNSDLCLHPENEECKIASTTKLGAIEVQGIGLKNTVDVNAQINGTEAYIFEKKNAASANELVIAQDGTVIASTPVPGTGPSHLNSESSSSNSGSYSVMFEDSEHGSVSVSPKNARKGETVTITVTPDKGYVLETITVTDESGNALTLTDKGSGKYTFTMPSGSVTVRATFMEDNTMLNFFTDVKSGDYYYDAVLWAVSNGITTGTDATHFSPNGSCARAQAVTFLWRAAGSPAPSNREMPFADVSADSYYYDAVLWALENDITKGISDTCFGPDETCTRAQIVTFLWRSQSSPAADAANPFADVKPGSYYADAVLWAVKNDITKGTGAATFSPDADCTRAQIVTFLWRALA